MPKTDPAAPTLQEALDSNLRAMVRNMEKGEQPEKVKATGEIRFQPVNTRTLVEARTLLLRELERQSRPHPAAVPVASAADSPAPAGASS